MLLSDLLYNIQEPYRFLAFLGAIIFLIVLLFLDKFMENRKLHKRIMADIKEKKQITQTPV